MIRRAVLDPLWLPEAVALAVGYTVVGLVGLLLTPLDRRQRVPRLCALALVYLYVDVSVSVRAFALWLRHPTRRREAERWQAAHCALLLWALRTFHGAATRLVGFRVALEPGLAVPLPGAPLIVLARHGGAGDSFALVELLIAQLGRRPRVVLKQSLLWDPGLDIVLTRLSGCFLPSGSGSSDGARDGDGDELCDRLAAVAAGLDPADALLLFPEGGNWTPGRHRRAVLHLLRAGRRQAARAAQAHEAVLPPRPGGALACLAARPDADVLVVAHAGLDTLVSVRQLWRAVPFQHRPMRVTWWLIPAADVPRDGSAAEEWLRRQWDEVDARVGEVRRA